MPKQTKPDVTFLLPDTLGWECNDEISEYIDKWMDRVYEALKRRPEPNFAKGFWQAAKAELMDNIFYIIQKYQTEDINEKATKDA